MQLSQDKYTDHNGREIDASVIEGVTSYKHIADGFYDWDCFKCGAKHSSRSCGWPIAGQVLDCQAYGCKAMNLLLRSDCNWYEERMKVNGDIESLKKENERLKAIQKYNDEQIQTIRWQITNHVANSINELVQKLRTENHGTE